MNGTVLKNIEDGLRELTAAEKRVNLKRPASMAGTPEAIREAALALNVETAELLQELDWKPWKRRTDKVDAGKVASEFADVLAFVGLLAVNVMAATGLDELDLAAAFCEVVERNAARAAGAVAGYAPILDEAVR